MGTETDATIVIRGNCIWFLRPAQGIWHATEPSAWRDARWFVLGKFRCRENAVAATSDLPGRGSTNERGGSGPRSDGTIDVQVSARVGKLHRGSGENHWMIYALFMPFARPLASPDWARITDEVLTDFAEYLKKEMHYDDHTVADLLTELLDARREARKRARETTNISEY